MNETSCGKVSDEERDEIQKLFARKTALGEVVQAMSRMDPKQIEAMYEKVIADLGETSLKFHRWWEETAKRHGWPAIEGAKWNINFETCEVVLVHQ
jgi:CXXX repeat modification system protein